MARTNLSLGNLYRAVSGSARVAQAVSLGGLAGASAGSNASMISFATDAITVTPPTYTYIVDMNGRPHKLCDSLGYGLPYATQYTNPQMPQQPFNGSVYVLPQADPNGLFSPAAAEGTWVMLLDADGQPHPVYIEPRVIVSPFKLNL